MKVLINVHLLVNELYEYQNVRCNDNFFPPCLKAPYSCSANKSKSVSVSCQSPFCIKHLKKTPFAVSLMYMWTIWMLSLQATCARRTSWRAEAALWTPLLCTDKVLTWLQIVRLLFVHVSFNDAVTIEDVTHTLWRWRDLSYGFMDY